MRKYIQKYISHMTLPLFHYTILLLGYCSIIVIIVGIVFNYFHIQEKEQFVGKNKNPNNTHEIQGYDDPSKLTDTASDFHNKGNFVNPVNRNRPVQINFCAPQANFGINTWKSQMNEELKLYRQYHDNINRYKTSKFKVFYPTQCSATGIFKSADQVPAANVGEKYSLLKWKR